MDLGAPVPAAGGLRRHLTDRLELRAFSLDDLDAVYTLMSDPRVWEHRPAGVHTSRRRTAEQLSRGEQACELDGLGYWSMDAQQRRDVRRRRGLPTRRRRGLPTRRHSGLAAARALDAALPVVASVLAHNSASRAVAAADGLRLVSQVAEREGTRLLYCDRDVDPEPIEAMRSR